MVPPKRAARPAKPLLKVVAHPRDRELIKGYTDSLPVVAAEALLNQGSGDLPEKIQVRPIEGRQKKSTLELKSLKALFFVKSFKGHPDYQEVKFFQTRPPIEGLWVRMQFYDKEFLEAVVRNSVDFLLGPGFFVKPPDPESNNEVIYVVKSSLIGFQVLGVTSTF